MSAKNVVKSLLENEDMNADAAKDYALGAGLDLSGVTPEQTQVFKRQANGYIKWIMGDSYNPGVGEDIENAQTFDEVAEILRLYDDAELPFLEMISQGYF